MLTSASTWSQVLTSGYGVVGVFIAAAIFTPASFGTFSLLVLLQATLIGYLRAGVLHPGLVHQRTAPAHRTSFIALMKAMLLPFVVYLAAALALVPSIAAPELLLILGGTVATITHDWLRHRAFAEDMAPRALISDAVRLICTSSAALLVFPGSTPLQAFTTVMLCACPSVALLLCSRALWAGGERSAAAHRDLSRWQSFEFALGQLQLTVPLWLLGLTSSSAHVSAFRLAQTWLGPINLLVAALATTFLVDAIKLTNEQVELHARQLAARTFFVVLMAVVTLSVIGLTVPAKLSATSPADFAVALLCVGLSLVAGAHAVVQLAAMRTLREAHKVSMVRCGAVATTWASYTVGYLTGGPEISLVCGFIATAAFWATFSALRLRRRPRPHL